MSQTLSVVGGTYHEVCVDPETDDLYGSALRGAAALGERDFKVELISCIAEKDFATVTSVCDTFGIAPQFTFIDETVTFLYYHPLSSPDAIGTVLDGIPIQLPDFSSDIILYYGMIEARVAVHGNYVVYDPQNHIPFSATGSTAKHLSLVLNKNEACLLSGADDNTSLDIVGRSLLTSQKADVVVIKNGSKGAVIVEKDNYKEIPVYQTHSVWPIGSGDVFSAVFAWQWAIEHSSPYDAAIIASRYTATYCQSKLLPLPSSPENLLAITTRTSSKKIYLAGPFFTMSQRWLINEFRTSLTDFGNEVFSPYHEVGVVQLQDIKSGSIPIAEKDLKGLRQADLILAILCDSDPGTLFEIGYAKAIGKEVIIFSENIKEADLLMLYGTQCTIISDFSTAVFMASW